MFHIPRSHRCALLSVLLLATTGIVNGQRFPVYKDLHDFGGTVTNANGKTGPDGYAPVAGIALDSAGNAYGTSPNGGANGGSTGIVWEVTKSGTYIDLHDFGGTVTNANGKSGPDGADPVCNVVIDTNGNIYGTTLNGGANNLGILWEITKSGTYKDLHDFGGSITSAAGQTAKDGINPHANVTIDSTGNIYGTTMGGGQYGSGIVWELTPTGTYKDLHDFGDKYIDGSELLGSVALDKSGDLIGTTAYGGANNTGIVWMITPSGAFQHLHDFGGTIKNADGKSGPDGTSPSSGVTIDSVGNIFGTIPTGGANNGGLVWEINPSGTYFDLHDFAGTITDAEGQSSPDGEHPLCVVTIGSDGNLYGSASIGGPYGENNGNNGAGMVWEITKAGSYIDLFDVGGNVPHPGFAIEGAVVFDSNGNLFVTSIYGGANYSGTVWELGALTINSVTVSPTSVLGGQPSTGTVTLNGVATTGGTSVSLSSSSVSAIVPTAVTVAAGTSAATFSIATSAVGTSTPATITAEVAGLSQTATITVTPATLSSLTISPTTVVGGISSIGTVTLSGPAPTGGTVISLTSNSSSAIPPTSVTVPAGKSTMTFGIGTVQVATATSVSISAQLAGTTLSASLTVNPLALTSLTLSPSTVTGGNSSTGSVVISGPAGTSGAVVTLSSSATSVATLPVSVTIAPGKISGTFAIATTVEKAQKTSTISATFASATQSATLNVVPAILQSVTLNPSTLTGGAISTGTVTLTGPALLGGAVVKLKSSSTAATVPASVTILGGKTSVSFPVKTVVVSTVEEPTITATFGTATQTASLTINPAVIQSIKLSPATVVGLTASTGTLTLTGAAPTGGIKVQLSSSNSAATVPTSVTVAAGRTSVTFTVKTLAVTSQTNVTITGIQGTLSQTGTLTVNPPVLKALTLSPASLVGGKTSAGTVSLGSAAPAGGITITLATNSKSATVPMSVTVAGGATSTTFKVTTTAVTSTTKAAITATLGSVTQTANLTINK